LDDTIRLKIATGRRARNTTTSRPRRTSSNKRLKFALAAERLTYFGFILSSLLKKSEQVTEVTKKLGSIFVP